MHRSSATQQQNPSTPQQARYVHGSQHQQTTNVPRRPFIQQMQFTQQQQSGRQQQMQNFVSGTRKRRRLVDRVIMPEIRQLVPEADAYSCLLTYEQKLDALIARKRLEIQEALKRPLKIKRKLRIYVSHSFVHGKEPEHEGDEGVIPMWELRVEGRLLNEPPSVPQNPASSFNTSVSSIPALGRSGGSFSSSASSSTTIPPPLTAVQRGASTGTTSSLIQHKRKFSSFFKSLVIELDKNIYGPDNHLVEWHRTPQTGETDGFQVKRPGNMDVKCTILLLLDHQPMKFKLHPRLAKLLGIPVETRMRIIEALWQYIKTHKLQDATDHDVINCDHYLEQVFNCTKMRFMEVPQRLQQLLQQPDPLVIHHVIKWDGSSVSDNKNTACYDIEVELDDPVKQLQSTFLQSNSNYQEIMAYDQKIHEIVDNINELKHKRDFFAGFSENPQQFVQDWLISQSNDLRTLAGASVNDNELERRVEKYLQPDVQEGVYRYIYGKVQQKRFELECTLGVRNN